tara:strand:- start:8431 stop:9093 length:663 start_codon:yes stop_codon:yes gene_type:complete
MSKINVDTWEPESSTAMTMGASGDTTTVPSGASLVVASGATINITGATQTGFPDSGLSFASQWRLNTDQTCSSAAPGSIIAANWEVPEAEDLPGKIGAVMAVDGTTGAWTFPDTGIWQVSFDTDVYSPATTYDHTATAYLYTTHNSGTNWYQAAYASVTNKATGSTNELQRLHITYLVDIVTKTTHFVRFSVGTDAYSSVCKTSTDANQTYATFIKLGET